MPSATPTSGTAYEDGGATCMARVVGNNGANITQATINAATFKVFDLSELPGKQTGTGTLTVADVVFDTLQTDARWTVDSTGYNFRHTVPASAFPLGGRKYRVEYLFDPTSGEDFFVAFDITVTEVYTS